MADTVRRATWHTIASFLVVVAFISVTVFTLRYGWRVERNAEDYCAFGSGEVNDATTLYVTQGNIADTVFKEPFETAVVILWSTEMFTFSTHEASRVSCPVVKIIETLRAAGYGIPDIAIVVHNHFSPTGFTDADRATYQYLKARGFCGSFGIWYTALKEYKDIERDK